MNYIYNTYFIGKGIHAKVVAMPSGAFFLDYNGYKDINTNYSNGMKWVFDTQNISSNCNKIHKNECIFVQNIGYKFLVNVFMLISKYDSWHARYILGTANKSYEILNEYGKNFSDVFMNSFMKYNNSLSNNYSIYGAFMDACYHHGVFNRPKWWNHLVIDGDTQASAFKQFYVNKKRYKTFWYQNESFPCAFGNDFH